MVQNWMPRPSLNVSRAGLATATIGERIYAIGGFGPEFTTRDSVEVRSPAPDEAWHPVVPMLTPRANLGAVAVNDRIYVFGGDSDHGSTKLAEVGTSANEGEPIAKWEPIAKLPKRLRGPGTATFDGKIYLIGGEVHGGGFTDEVHVYDPDTDSWSSDAQPMPTRRGFARVARLDEWLYAIGGANNDGFLDTVERYKPATDTWEDVAPMGHRRGGPGVVTVNDRIYVVGGSTGEIGPGSDAEQSSEVFAEPAWHPLDAVFPVGRSNLRAERASGNRILAIGGFKAPGGPGTTVPSRRVEALKI